MVRQTPHTTIRSTRIPQATRSRALNDGSRTSKPRQAVVTQVRHGENASCSSAHAVLAHDAEKSKSAPSTPGNPKKHAHFDNENLEHHYPLRRTTTAPSSLRRPLTPPSGVFWSRRSSAEFSPATFFRFDDSDSDDIDGDSVEQGTEARPFMPGEVEECLYSTRPELRTVDEEMPLESSSDTREEDVVLQGGYWVTLPETVERYTQTDSYSTPHHVHHYREFAVSTPSLIARLSDKAANMSTLSREHDNGADVATTCIDVLSRPVSAPSWSGPSSLDAKASGYLDLGAGTTKSFAEVC